MKAIPCPTTLAASASQQPACRLACASAVLSQMGLPQMGLPQTGLPQALSQTALSQASEAETLPRAMVFAGRQRQEHLGFSVASEQLAQRRSAQLHQEDNSLEAMQSKLSYLLPAGYPVSGYLQGRRPRPLPLCTRKVQQYRALAEADQERSQLTPTAQFEPHDLDEQLLGDLQRQLQRYPLARAELVKKTLRFFPEQPLYVLLIAPAVNGDAALPPLPESILGTQIAQELCFQRELLVCLVQHIEPQLVARIQAASEGNLLRDIC